MEFVQTVKFKIIALSAVAPAITPAILLLSVKGKQCCVTAFVHVMTVVTASHFVKPIPSVHAERSVTMELVDLHVLCQINAQKDKYAKKMFVFPDVITMQIVVMTCYVLLNFA